MYTGPVPYMQIFVCVSVVTVASRFLLALPGAYQWLSYMLQLV